MRVDRVKLIAIMAKSYFTVNDLANKSGVSRPTVTGVRSGKSCSVTTANKIAKALGVDVTEILEKV